MLLVTFMCLFIHINSISSIPSCFQSWVDDSQNGSSRWMSCCCNSYVPFSSHWLCSHKQLEEVSVLLLSQLVSHYFPTYYLVHNLLFIVCLVWGTLCILKYICKQVAQTIEGKETPYQKQQQARICTTKTRTKHVSKN